MTSLGAGAGAAASRGWSFRVGALGRSQLLITAVHGSLLRVQDETRTMRTGWRPITKVQAPTTRGQQAGLLGEPRRTAIFSVTNKNPTLDGVDAGGAE